MRFANIVVVFLTIVSAASAGELLIHEWAGAVGSETGEALDAAGDVDGDGVPDVLVGARGDGPNGEGSVRVLSGQTGLPILSFSGSASATVFAVGEDVAGVGDLDGDGHADVAVGAPLSHTTGTFSGRAVVLSGKTGAPLFVRDGVAGARFGFGVAAVSDVDGDGFTDWGVGAPYESADQGVVRVLSGFDGSVLHLVVGAPNARLGAVVEGVGDVDADGVPDFAGGQPSFAAGAGRATVFSGFDTAPLIVRTGSQPLENVGEAILGGLDLDQDGFDDVAVGAPGETQVFPYVAGRVDFVSGQTAGVLFSIHGDAPKDRFGASLGGVADLNGDGGLELVVGASGETEPWVPGGFARGAVRVVSMATKTTLSRFYGGGPQEWMGSASAVIGDVDGDGRPDYAGGGWGSDVFGGNAGRVVVLSGRCAPSMVPVAYGEACPGVAGVKPVLTTTGCLAAGCVGGLRLTGADGFAGFSFAAFLVGTQKATQPIGGGCSLLIGNVAPFAAIAPVTGSGPGQGTATAQGTIPASAAGITFTAQGFAEALGYPLGFAPTHGLQVFVNP